MLPSSDILLRDMFLVGLTRILNGEDYVNEICNPLFRTEALIHLDASNNECRVENDMLERMIKIHPIGVLIYLYRFGLASIGLRTFVKIMKLIIKRIDILALAIGYTGSEMLYKDIFVSLVEDEKNAKNILNISILLDIITFRYNIDEALPFTFKAVERFMSNKSLPDILRRMHLSTLLATKKIRGEDMEEIYRVLTKGLRLGCDDITFLQAAPIIAKNLYISGDRERFKDILIRLKELKSRTLDNLGPFSFITPTSPSVITKTLNKIVWVIDRIVLVFNMLSRSKNFSDEKFAVEYLRSLFRESKDPTILSTLTRFLIRHKPNNSDEIINDYLSLARKILPKNEREIIYRHLGMIYALKITNNRARKTIEDIVSKNINWPKQFTVGLYEETLKQYVLKSNF